MNDTYNIFLIIGAAFSAAAAVMHIGCIIYGASWYRFFGAGERMAQLASTGSLKITPAPERAKNDQLMSTAVMSDVTKVGIKLPVEASCAIRSPAPKKRYHDAP